MYQTKTFSLQIEHKNVIFWSIYEECKKGSKLENMNFR